VAGVLLDRRSKYWSQFLILAASKMIFFGGSYYFRVVYLKKKPRALFGACSFLFSAKTPSPQANIHFSTSERGY
jgi:hypothetical protein